MAIGTFKLITRIDNSKAKTDAKEFEKIVDTSAKKAADSGKDTVVDIDIKKAKKEIESLEKEIDRYEAKLAKLESGKLDSYDAERDSILASTKDMMSRTSTPEQRIAVQKINDLQMQKVDEKYSNVLAEAKQYSSIIDNNKAKIRELKASIDRVTQAESQLNNKAKDSAMSTLKHKSLFNGLSAAMRKAAPFAHQLASYAGKTAQKIGTGVVGGLKKATVSAGKLAKHLGKRLVNGLKSALTRLKDMSKQTSRLRKKFTKIGFALLGMRGAMGALKQIVSSVLNNNEKLQNQLTAVKGVLGQALAPAMNVLVQGLAQMVSFADKLYQIFTGTSLVAKYNAQQTKKQADAAADAADSAKKAEEAQLASFDVANKLNDNNSNSSSSSSGDTASLFEATNINSWLQSIIDQMKAGNWESVGGAIASGINSSLKKIDWSNIQTKVNNFCTNIGKAVNGFVDMLDWDAVGNAAGQAINTITNGINSLVHTIEWDSVGAGMATGLNGLVNSIDGEALGKTLSAKLKIITDTLYGFFNGDGKNDGFNFANFGTKIGDTVNGWFDNIDWAKAGSNITSAISGLGDTIAGAADKIDWTGIKKSIEDFFSDMDWSTATSKLVSGLGKALGGLSSVLAGLICDAFGNIKNYFDNQIDKAGGDIIEGIFNGIVNWLKNVGTWIYDNILQPFISGFRSAFDIHSPTKNATLVGFGSDIIEGIFNGIIDWLKNVKSWLKKNVFDKITKAWDGMNDLTLTIKGKIGEGWSNAKNQWESISSKGKSALATLKGSTHSSFTTAKKNWDSIKNKAFTVTAKLADGITSGVRKILNSLCNMINKIIRTLNKLPGVKISPIKPPKLAKGGIANTPGRGTTVTVGEAGREAILPLDNNTGWMDSLADKLAQRINANTQMITSIINLDGETLAKKISQVNNRRNVRMNGGVI